MKFDVRIDVDEEITEIVFGDIVPTLYLYLGTVIKPWGPDKISILDDGESEVGIKDKEHAENLIKALQKAIEIGWLK